MLSGTCPDWDRSFHCFAAAAAALSVAGQTS